MWKNCCYYYSLQTRQQTVKVDAPYAEYLPLLEINKANVCAR